MARAYAFNIGKIDGKDATIILREDNVLLKEHTPTKSNWARFSTEGMLEELVDEGDLAMISDTESVADPKLMLSVGDGRISYIFSARDMPSIDLPKNNILYTLRRKHESAEYFKRLLDEMEVPENLDALEAAKLRASEMISKAARFDTYQYATYELVLDRKK